MATDVSQESVIGHENVPQFHESLLTDFLPMYDIQALPLEPVEVGWPCRRPRTYRSLVHRTKIVQRVAPFSIIKEIFARRCNITFESFFVAGDEDPRRHCRFCVFTRSGVSTVSTARSTPVEHSMRHALVCVFTGRR